MWVHRIAVPFICVLLSRSCMLLAFDVQHLQAQSPNAWQAQAQSGAAEEPISWKHRTAAHSLIVSLKKQCREYHTVHMYCTTILNAHVARYTIYSKYKKDTNKKRPIGKTIKKWLDQVIFILFYLFFLRYSLYRLGVLPITRTEHNHDFHNMK